MLCSFQISDIVYPPKATTTSTAKPKSTVRSSQKPPGHVARAPMVNNVNWCALSALYIALLLR